MPRMNILKADEQRQFDTPPVFNAAQRKQYFDFPNSVLEYAEKLRSHSSKIAFLLSYGYFRACKRFFTLETYHLRDIEYVAKKISCSVHDFNIGENSARTYRRHRPKLLDICGFKEFNNEAEKRILQEINSMVFSHRKPASIFWNCVNILIKERVQIPSYQRIADLIIKAFKIRKEELSQLVASVLTPEMTTLLDGFLEKEGKENSAKDRYKLTLLKKLSQSSKPTKVQERILDLVLLQDLHSILHPVFNVLNFDHEAMRYYAGSVIKSRVFQISRRAEKDKYIHLISFIAHQYYCLQDNLIDVLLSAVQTFQNTSRREYKDLCFSRRAEHNLSINKILNFMDTGVFQVLDSIEIILRSDNNAEIRLQDIERY